MAWGLFFRDWKVLMSSTFHRLYFLGHIFFYSSPFSAVCKTIFLESTSSINTHRSSDNLWYIFGYFHFLQLLSFSLLSVFVKKFVFSTIFINEHANSLHQQLSRHICRSSGLFLDYLDTFSRLSGHCLDLTETFQIIHTLLRLSRYIF